MAGIVHSQSLDCDDYKGSVRRILSRFDPRPGPIRLGLEAQREAVIRFTGQPPVSEFTEVESGKRHENRPQLKAAMDDCKRHRRRLVIAKLDRLTRDPDFVGELFKSSVDFVAADNPHANKITIRILAAVAEHEREMISRRIKEALAVKKAQLAKEGKKLGDPHAAEALVLARAALCRAQPPDAVINMMARWRAEHKSLWQIADHLNQLGLRTGRGSRWYASSVSLQLKALAKRLRQQAPAPTGKSLDSMTVNDMTLDDFAAELQRQGIGRPIAR
jgi:hypothetical protein